MSADWSIIINFILGTGIIIQGISKIINDTKIKEAKDEIIKTKDAQIAYYKELLDAEKEKNDVVITEMFKKRNENLKIILSEKEQEIDHINHDLVEKTNQLHSAKQNEVDQETIEAELLKIRLDKEQLENDKLMLLYFMNEMPVPDVNADYPLEGLFPGLSFNYSSDFYIKYLREHFAEILEKGKN